MWFWPAELHHMPLKKSSYDETLYISLSAFKTLILMLYSPRSICEIISRLADNPINSYFAATLSWDSLAFLRSMVLLIYEISFGLVFGGKILADISANSSGVSFML